MKHIERVSGIYQIKNTFNGKIYIGSSKNMNTRLRGHIVKLRNDQHCNSHLQSAFNKYGEDVFDYSVIEFCSEEMLIEREQFYVDMLGVISPKIGYNKASDIRRTAGYKWTNASKIKLSNSKKGMKMHENTKKALIEANKSRIYNSGYKISKEEARKRALGHSKPVLQYDLDGNFIKKWDHSILATEFYRNSKGKCNILSCCKGKRYKAYEYQWYYLPTNNLYPKKVLPYIRKHSKENLNHFMSLCSEMNIRKECELLENPEEDNQQPRATGM